MEFLYQLSYNWFLLYYFALGSLLTLNGIIWAARPQPFLDYMIAHAKNGKPPHLLLKTLRYLFLFSLVSLGFAFFPFSWVELIFSGWCLLMIYILGSFLLRWKLLSKIILEQTDNFRNQIRTGGFMMISIGVIMFFLVYQHTGRTF